MNQKFLKPRQALNKAFLKVKPVRIQIEIFKENLIRLLDQINESELEGCLRYQIDQLVYELYGLTEEEIRIVEGGEG